MSVGDDYLDLLIEALCGSLYDESAWKIVRPRRALGGGPRRLLKVLARNWTLRAARLQGLIVVKPKRYDADVRRIGQDWPLFGYTMIGRRRLENVRDCIQQVLSHAVPGDLIETGAWRGGCAIFMRAVLKHHQVTDRLVWVADSFQGMPKPNQALYGQDAGLDLSEFDYLKVSLDQVKANFARFDLLDEQVRFIPGWFNESLPAAPIKRLALLRLDGDLYESTIDALRALYHKVSPGGFVIIDDYQDWPSCRKAVDDFRAEHGIKHPIELIDKNGGFWRLE